MLNEGLVDEYCLANLRGLCFSSSVIFRLFDMKYRLYDPGKSSGLFILPESFVKQPTRTKREGKVRNREFFVY